MNSEGSIETYHTGVILVILTVNFDMISHGRIQEICRVYRLKIRPRKYRYLSLHVFLRAVILC
jgi:hypothetical protein